MEHIYQSLKFSVFNTLVFMKRSGRREYWTFVLASAAIYISLLILMIISLFVMPGFINALILPGLGGIATCISVPMIALSVRRMHDVGKNGWWILISFVPFIGAIIYIYLTLLPSSESNQWGQAPIEIQELEMFSPLDLDFEQI